MLSVRQLLGDLFPGDVLFCHKYHAVIQEITDLIFDLIGVRILGGDDDLRCFLSQFFQDLVNSLIEQVIGVGSFLGMHLAVLDDCENFLEDLKRIVCFFIFLLRDLVKETAPCARMAGNADLIDLCEDGVKVAIRGQAPNKLEMSAGLSLEPL